MIGQAMHLSHPTRSDGSGEGSRGDGGYLVAPALTSLGQLAGGLRLIISPTLLE